MEVELPETIEECHSLIRNLLAVIEKMQTEIDELKARLNQNSQNSNRPPSSDGFNKPKPAFSKKKKRRGGQKGHRGRTLKRVAEPDVVIECEPVRCRCGAAEWLAERPVAEVRQVFELPAPKLEVIEYRRIRRTCRCCGQTSAGEFPEKVTAPVQYGEQVQAMVALLSVHGCLSFGKIGQLFADLYGYELNEATAQAMVRKTAEVMPVEAIKRAVRESAVANFDETGIRENGVLKWLHNASTADWTYQYVHAKRGAEALRDERSVLPQFEGVAVHDCWSSYFSFGQMKHALCNAHILRELTGLIENGGAKWAGRMKRLLLAMYVASDYGKGRIARFEKYEKRYDRLLEAGEREEPPPERTGAKGKSKRTKGRNLLERLMKYKEAVLRFAREEEVPFTNNQAERDVRPAKVKQKMSGGFRAANGSESYCRIQSFIASLRKQSREVFQELLAAIQGKQFEFLQT